MTRHSLSGRLQRFVIVRVKCDEMKSIKLLILLIMVFGLILDQVTSVIQGKDEPLTGVLDAENKTVENGNLTLSEFILQLANKVSTLEAEHRDFVEIMGKNLQWELMMSPIPLGIGVLGELMIVATNSPDVALNATKNNFQHLKYPGSLRASLFQLSNMGHSAFLQAHINMDRIRLNTQILPYFLKKAVGIVTSKRPRLISQALPSTLARVRDAMQRNVQFSLEVTKGLEHVSDTADEILEAMRLSQGYHEHQLRNATQELDLEKSLATTLQQHWEKLEADKENDLKKRDQFEKKIRERLAKLPSGGDVFGMDFLDFITSSRTASSNQTTAQNIDFDFDDDLLDSAGPNGTPQVDCFLTKNQSTVAKLVHVADQLLKLAENDFKTPSGSGHLAASQADYFRRALESLALNNTQCENLAKLGRTALDIVDGVETRLKSDKFNETQDLTEKIRKFRQEVIELKNYAEKEAKKSMRPGHVQELMKQLPTTGRAAAIHIANLKYLIALDQDNLRSTYDRLNHTSEQSAATFSDYVASLVKMHSANFTQITEQNTTEFLKEGLRVFSKLKEQWRGLTRYFGTVQNLLQVTHELEIQRVVSTLNQTRTPSGAEIAHSIVASINDTLMGASQRLAYLHSMAETYTKLSSQYIMPSMNQLDIMMTFDLETNGATLAQKRQELLESCLRDSAQIQVLVLTQKDALLSQLKERMQKIREQYSLLLEKLDPGNYLDQTEFFDEYF